MMTTIRTATTAAALLAALALPIASQAATTTTAPTQHYVLQSHMTESSHAGGYDGTLRLAVTADGIVSGSYLPTDDGHVQIVTGGISGTRIWLEFGLDHAMRFDGTLKNGALEATANIPGPDVTTLVATVEPNAH